MPFNLEGPYGVLGHLEHLIQTKGSAVVCVAEGAGQVSSSVLYVDWLELQHAATGNIFSTQRQQTTDVYLRILI